MKKYIYLIIASLLLPSTLMAVSERGFDKESTEISSEIVLKVDKTIVYKGKILDDKTSEPLIGASILVKGTTIGTVTDVNGEFLLSLSDEINPVVFEISFIGYVKKEITPRKNGDIVIRLVENTENLEEVQVVAYGKQSKMSVTGAISSINTKDLLKSPSGSVANALAGAITGVSSVQTTGQPGAEDPNIYVRGTGSLTASASKPLILVDGVERSFFQMDPNEIESITVLKDAASTAVFGVRGANGVILVTTRRGVAGKPKISLSSSFGLTQALRNLKGVDSYSYANLYTEAQRNDNPNISDDQLKFSPYVTEMFRTNADPIMFPNVDWGKYIFKDLAWQTQHNVTLSGGADRFRYFVSLGYLGEDGMMKRTYEVYDPNYSYKRFNYRSNIDIDLTKSTLLRMNIGGRVGIKREPQTYDIWRNIMWCTPFASPGFVDGKFILNQNNKYIPLEQLTSGLDCYYNWGYQTTNDNVLNMDLSLNQRLDMLTKGLSFSVKGAYNTNYSMTVKRGPTVTDSAYTPIYLGTKTQPGMDISDPRFDNTIVYQTDGVMGLREPLSYGDYTGRGRNWYAEASLNYNRSFGNHEVTALFLYNQSKTYYPDEYTEIPTAYVGYVGRITYNWKKRYMLDLNAGYNGSENFAPGKRFGFFPAASVGWILSEEKFMKKFEFLDFLKLRASYGIVGNDKYSGHRFLYLNGSWNGNHQVWGGNGSYQFGQGGSYSLLSDAKENTIGNAEVTWEKVGKQNYGIDVKMFDAQLSFTADIFFEKRKDILSTRNTLPSIADIQLPLINLGKVNNHGYELSLGWDSRAGKVDYWLRGNVSYSKNKIMFMDEVVPNEPYMAQTGRSTGLNFGYLFDRFLQKSDFDEQGNLKVDSKGKQILPEMSLGNPRPGDALFRDLNQDGKIDGNDKTYFGYSDRPDYTFGLLGGLRWKNFEFSMQWTAALNASRLLYQEYRDAFGSTNSRMLLKFLADGRWREGNEDNARFPRLTFQSKSHYMDDSDLWLMNGSYLRLKTAEISYTFTNRNLLKKIGVESVKLYCNGYNLLTLFSDLNDIDIDPEGMTSGENSAYPNIRIYNFGVNISF